MDDGKWMDDLAPGLKKTLVELWTHVFHRDRDLIVDRNVMQRGRERPARAQHLTLPGPMHNWTDDEKSACGAWQIRVETWITNCTLRQQLIAGQWFQGDVIHIVQTDFPLGSYILVRTEWKLYNQHIPYRFQWPEWPIDYWSRTPADHSTARYDDTLGKTMLMRLKGIDYSCFGKDWLHLYLPDCVLEITCEHPEHVGMMLTGEWSESIPVRFTSLKSQHPDLMRFPNTPIVGGVFPGSSSRLITSWLSIVHCLANFSEASSTLETNVEDDLHNLPLCMWKTADCLLLEHHTRRARQLYIDRHSILFSVLDTFSIIPPLIQIIESLI